MNIVEMAAEYRRLQKDVQDCRDRQIKASNDVFNLGTEICRELGLQKHGGFIDHQTVYGAWNPHARRYDVILPISEFTDKKVEEICCYVANYGENRRAAEIAVLEEQLAVLKSQDVVP